MADDGSDLISEADKAKAFLEFEYPETKDLAKHFLTVVAAVLAVSLTFSDKMIDFTAASSSARFLIMSAWALGIVAFFFGGCGIFLMFNAGLCAKHDEVHNGAFRIATRTYNEYAELAFNALKIGGVTFVLSLLLLVISGISRILAR